MRLLYLIVSYDAGTGTLDTQQDCNSSEIISGSLFTNFK